jgi:hypothetical protein
MVQPIKTRDASGADLGLQDGRRRLVEVVGWLRWKPARLVAVGPGKPSRPSATLPGGWADGDGMTSRR